MGRSVFLTSSPCDDNVPAGVSLPCIFFTRNRFVMELQKRVAPGGVMTMVAAYPEDARGNDEMLATFAGCFAYHGMAFREAHMLDSRNSSDAKGLIAASDVVLLAGGHVPTENAFFHRIGLPALLQRFEGVVMGISAGSMNCCDPVYAQPEEKGEAIDPDFRRFIPGLGLTEIQIIPHYQMVKDNILDGMRLYEDITYGDSMGRSFYAIPDGSYVLVENGRALLYGEGYLIRNGKMRQLTVEEDIIQLPV
ncbi:MAG: Type 1 glutamine amidotransferase-like domain-containing protein [Clostridia bacterium]|nr:Type 1 glutamine amidotransferase-like domain-containing protein [Clostridia bacterium]